MTALMLKDSQKEINFSNYRSITCLPIIWKILTVHIKGKIDYSLVSLRLFLEEQKGYCKGTRGTGDLQYTDQHILKESKTRQKLRGLTTIGL